MLRATFYLVIVASGTAAIGCGSCAQKPQASPTSGLSAAGRQEFAEFSFDLPQNWTRGTPDRGKTIAMLLLGGARWDLAKGMIKIDVGSPAFPTAQLMAENFAKASGGQVAKNAVDVDGEKGIKVTTSSNNMDTPRIMIIVYRRGKAYLIMAASVQETDISDAVEAVRKSWKWSS